ncbi:hypothetical protein Tco_1036686, partial [Tanacetum coccineum]
PDSEKMMEGLPRSIEGNVTASKPQTLEEAINIAHMLMDQNRRQEVVRAYAATPAENNEYIGNHPLCKKCTLHHTSPCTVKCNICNKRKRTLCKSVPKDHQQQYPGKSLNAKG